MPWFGLRTAEMKDQEYNQRTSQVVQWFRIRLPIQGIRVGSLVLEDPTCIRVTKLMHHNY